MARTFDGNVSNRFESGPAWEIPTNATILFRAKVPTDAAPALFLMGRRNGGGWFISRGNVDNEITFTSAGIANYNANAGSFPKDGNWHAYALTFAGNSLTFYRDSTTNVGTATISRNALTGIPLMLGTRNDNGTADASSWDGDLAEVALFSRTLDSTDLQAWFDADSPELYSTNLDYYWKLDETSGDAADSGPSNDTFTLVGTLASATHPTMNYGAVATITLTDPVAVVTGSTASCTITRNTAASGNITYNLTSSATGVATVPSTATILDGQITGSFNITGVSAGSSTITATNAADSGETDTATANVSALKGLTVTFGQANLSGLTFAWFDEASPDLFAAPTVVGTTESTDGSGVLEINLTGTSVAVGNTGFLLIYKAGATAPDDIAFFGRLTVQDIG